MDLLRWGRLHQGPESANRDSLTTVLFIGPDLGNLKTVRQVRPAKISACNGRTVYQLA